jgi:molybdenum-dependent DNA-binding transcriptional regulator ModE
VDAMDFNQLRYVVEIVQTGSISKAASNLFLSQPNLSNQITILENEIGKNIFYRSNRGVTLTAYGVEVYHYAKSIIKQFEIIEDKLLTKANDNKIKVASFGSEVINFKFFEVCEKYNNDNYEFELCETGVEEAIERVIQRNSDIAIIIYSEFQRKKLLQYLVAEDLELQDLFVGQMKIHMSKNHELSKRDILCRADLIGLFHIKKSYFFEGMFGLNQEMEYLGIPDTNKTILANGNKTYNDALRYLPSFAIEIDWKCKKKIHSDLERISYEGKSLDMTCAMVKRKNEILKEELKFFISKLIESYN